MNFAQQHVGKVLLWLRPDGWQTRARRNAWAAMVADGRRRHERLLSHERQPAAAGPQGSSATLLGVQAR